MEENEEKPEIVVGIDFGSSGTGYAYSFNDPEKIILGNIQDHGSDIKVPTEIILDQNLDVLAFGDKCVEYIKENQLNKGELYFQRIKMSLYSNKATIKPQNKAGEYQLVDIISKLLEYVKNDAIKKIKGHRNEIDQNKIKWVVTVPAIWSENQKGIMIKASEKAGLFNKFTDRSSFFALEPEAASLYCSQDNALDPNYIQSGKTYTICDLGGGTGDIVTHTKNKEGKIAEKYHAVGGNFGSDEIDKEIFNLIINKIFGFKDYNSLKIKNENNGFPWENDELYNEWLNLQDEIQKRKKINEKSKDKITHINFQLFQKFTDYIPIEELVDEYNSKCHNGWNITIKNPIKWILSIPNKIFYDLIIRQANKVVEQINEINAKIPNIESILYVGGYCSNEIIFNYIKNKFPNMVHLKPSNPELAVVKGAVLFGIDPNIITERKAKYTIGFGTNSIWKEEIHSNGGEKYFDEIDKVYRCKNCFDLFIEIGQTLKINDKITHYFHMLEPRYCNLRFFKSYKKNPIFVNEEGVELIGRDVLDLKKDYPLNERDLVVEMKFGGTFVEAECIHKKSGIKIKLNLYFDK